MRFPSAEQLRLPCRFEHFTPGRLHTDGRRYLPLIILQPTGSAPAGMPAAPQLAVVDRHHVVDPAMEGSQGNARLVFLLSNLRIQHPPRQGLESNEGPASGRASTAPVAYGRVIAVPTWQVEQQHLPYESLYVELLLDIGLGVIGVRTNATAASLAEHLGKPRVEPGDWLAVWRSRIDILAFEVARKEQKE